MKDSHSPDTQSKDSVFSVYLKPVKNTTPTANVNIGDIYQSIIDPSVFATETAKIREAIDKETRNSLKANTLDFATFSGTFTKRSTKNLIQHSGLICIDIDDIDDIPGTKERIKSTLPPVLMFTSPSGNGLKVIYRIAISEADHLRYFRSLEQFFLTELNIGIDQSGKDVSRACFLCYDPEAYFNPNSPELDIAFCDTFSAPIPQPQRETTAITDYDQIMTNLKTWLNKQKSFIPGQRNAYITALAHAYNRFGVPQTTAEYDLLQYEQSDFKADEIKATVRSIYNQYTAQHGTREFTENTPYQFNEPTPIKQERQKTPLLPIDCFPEEIQDFINEYEQVYQTPRDYIAGSVMTATALAIGDKLELKDKFDNLPIIWVAIVGDVSSGKTDPLRTALHFFSKKDSEEIKTYKEKLKEFETYQGLTKSEKKTTPPVDEPEFKQFILVDYTPEALKKVHESNDRGLLILRDELKGWLDDFGRYTKSGEQSTMLSTFSRQALVVNRAGKKEPIIIPNPVILVAGGIQPDLLPDLAEDKRKESGFLARFIFVYPDKIKKPKYSRDKMSKSTLASFYTFLEALTQIPERVDLRLSAEAEELYAGWYNRNAEMTDKEETGYLKGVYGKLDIYALRLAIILKGMNIYFHEDDNAEITAEEMQGAIHLTEYFRATALKVYEKIFAKKHDMPNKDLIHALATKGVSGNKISQTLGIDQAYISRVLNYKK